MTVMVLRVLGLRLRRSEAETEDFFRVFRDDFFRLGTIKI
jgi:hypothetical protein